MMDERQRARERRRREEMIARRKRIRRLKIAIAAVLVLLIGLAVWFGVQMFRKTRSNRPGDGPGADPGSTPAVSVIKETSAPDVEGTDGQEGNQASGSDVQAAGTDEQETASGSAASADLMSQARLLAAGYDYDGAIALLSGSEMTEEMRQAVSEWESAKSACVAVDVNTVPHIFFHSLINDDRAFDVNTLGADRVRQNNAAMTTTVEFDHMIEDMYEAGYVLVSLDDMCVKSTGADGLVHIERNSSLMLPPDKKPFVLSMDFVQPLNLMDLSTYLLPAINTGLSVQFAPFVSLLAGFSLKGANPRISTGFEFEVAKIRLNLNYTLDLTSSTAPVNKISLSAKLYCSHFHFNSSVCAS